jgi:hypothetical protein
MSVGKRPVRAVARILLAGAAVSILGVVAVNLVGHQAHDGPDATPAARAAALNPVDGHVNPVVGPSGPAAARPAGTAPAPPGDTAAARRVVASYLAKAPTILSRRPKANVSAVAEVGTETFADELLASAAYNRKNGLHVVGSPDLAQVRVQSLDSRGRPPTAVVEACVDSSDVRIVDDQGHTVPQPRHGRSRQRFSLVWSDGAWLIDSQEFPDDPSC